MTPKINTSGVNGSTPGIGEAAPIALSALQHWMFPTRVGMNRLYSIRHNLFYCVPHTLSAQLSRHGLKLIYSATPALIAGRITHDSIFSELFELATARIAFIALVCAAAIISYINFVKR